MARNRTTDGDLSDEDLIARIAQEPDRVICELYRRHSDVVQERAQSVLGDRGLAEGVVQEVFLRLWQHPESFDPSRGSMRTYLAMLGRSRAIEQLRSTIARRKREERCAQGLENPQFEPSPGREVEVLVIAEQLRRAVSRLSDIERSAIEAAYFDGHTFVDVAKLLGRPEGTIKTRIRSGLGHLRVSMGPEITSDLH